MNKKKIDFITFHSAYNYGAALQTYATMLYFENKGYDVEIIDYVPKYLHNFGTLKNTFNQVDNKKKNILVRIIYTLIKTPSYKKIKKIFSRFNQKYYKLTKNYENYDHLLKDVPKADIYCCGSDQIWNNYYTEKFDDAFFLNFLKNNQLCFSFSSSFGKDKFSENDEKFIKNSLDKFSIITVRENTGKKILDDIGLKHSMQLLDPTLMVNFNIWNELADTKDRIIKDKYILLYQLHGDSDAYDYAIKFAKEKNMKVVRIITMYHQIKKGCKNIIVPEVESFVNLFKYAEYVFTDSFHGTAFSFIFQKKLGIRLPVRFSGRITSLLSLTNSNQFIIKDLDEWTKRVNDEYMLSARNSLMEYKKDVEYDFNEKFNKMFDEEMKNEN